MERGRRPENFRGNRAKFGRFNPEQPRQRHRGEFRPVVSKRDFSAEIREILSDVFFNSKISLDLGLSKPEVGELLEFKPTSLFNSVLNCCICYENTLICAIGKCDHMTCLLCSLKLSFFYKNDPNTGIYECPYCKQPNEYIFFCVNPFYAHLAKNRKFYSSTQNPLLTRDELKQFVSILTYSSDTCDKRLEQTLYSPTINIVQLYRIFLENVDKMVQLNGLTRSFSRLTLNQSQHFDKSYILPIADNDLILLPELNLIFESPGIYYLYRLITSPLCWFKECKAKWYFEEVNRDNLNEAISVCSKWKFGSYKALNRHIKSSHSMVFCDVCLNYFTNKKFVCEFVLYDTIRIGEHVKYGDLNSLPPINPHVCCPACKVYFWDTAAFRQHAKDEHFICEICDDCEASYNVFSDYDTLFNHFKTYHYPCEEKECMFIVFSDDLQLQLHYLYKHPGVATNSVNTRPVKSKKPVQVNLRTSNNEFKSTATSTIYYNIDDNSTLDSFWDGSIRIVDQVTPTITLQPVQPNQLDDKVGLVEELKDTTLYYYFKRDLSVNEAGKDEADKDEVGNLERFLRLLKGNRNLPVSSDYINNFDITRSSHVFTDLDNVSASFKSDLNLFDPAQYLGSLLSKLYSLILSTFDRQYNETVESCTGDFSDGSLFNLVKSYVLKLVLLLYSLNINRFKREKSEVINVRLDLIKLREHNSGLKLSPNGILFLNSLLYLSSVTNRLIVKAGLNAVVSDLKEGYKDTSSPMLLSQSLNISSAAMNPDADLSEYIKKPKAQNIVKIPRKEYIVSLKGKKVRSSKPKKQEPKPLNTPEPSFVPENLKVEEEVVAKSPVSKTDVVTLESVEIDSEALFMNHVSSGNFYGLMCDLVGNLLVSNMKRFRAKNFEYSLRETTRMKILSIALSQKRSLTNLGEFISMKKLESLQSLEPEFHRIAKSKGSDLPTVARLWNRKCVNMLKNMQVEHLEILHFYLKGNSELSMPLCNDVEFPRLTNTKRSEEFTRTRNYASAAGVKDRPKFMNDLEFPTLLQTANLYTKGKNTLH